MDALILARLQFSAVTVYHFFFVPLTLGLSILVAIMETLYVKRGNDKYLKATKFWGKLFLINFAIGVATGIVQEFQFGMNWSEYSRFVGDIFGAPLAIEALLAFFLESTFLGIWIFGWDKISPKLHAATIWLVAIGSNISAFWILVANSFMQEPTGYVLRNGRAEMTDFFAIVMNPHVWLQFPHVVTAGISTAAFFIIGISAWHLLRKSKEEAVFKFSMKLGLITGLVSILAVVFIGHSQMQHIAFHQPMKLAAAEAVWEDEDPAGLSLLTIGNQSKLEDVFSIRVPNLLSFLIYNRFEGNVRGLRGLQKEYEARFGPGDYIPPVAISYWSFRIMVGAGTLMLLLVLPALYYFYKDKLLANTRYLKLLFWALFLPYIANSTGWIFTELGRQPWIVQDLMRVEDGLSNTVSSGEVLFSLLVFILLYGALMVVDVYLLKKYAVAGVVDDTPDSSQV